LSIAQTVQLETRLGEEAFALIRKGDWRRARDLLLAAEFAGVSSLRDADGEKAVRLMIEETYAAEAREENDADPWRSTIMNLLHEEDKLNSHPSISRASTAASVSLMMESENDSAAAC
jgi:hypothetical protein